MSIALFADVSNLYPAVKGLYKAKIDYGKVINEFDGMARQYAYGVQVKDEAIHFITALKHLGYITKFKRLRKSEDWNIEITLDIVRMSDKCDCILVASNDLNLIPVYKWAKERGIYVCVLACENIQEIEQHVDQVFHLDERFLEAREGQDVPVAAAA